LLEAGFAGPPLARLAALECAALLVEPGLPRRLRLLLPPRRIFFEAFRLFDLLK